ncbi:MAG: RnfABCDGE type electron transport complex subunit B [Gammaproteobacteria bacterium]|nr:RnfABCDGE type electron transport complex subunit B [Gammaproteobacteria bacterium]
MPIPSRQAVSADTIDAWLPQTQCTRCGYPRCRDYAEAITRHEAGINQCPPGGEITIAALAGLLDIPRVPLDPRFGVHKPRARAVIDETVCIGCRKCLDVCPVDAIVGARKLMHTVIARECNGCELCLPPCPVDCIAMQPIVPAPDSAPWPEYTRVETDHWRARTGNRLRRLAQRKRLRAAARSSEATPAPDRERIRAEIRAAVARVRARKTGAGSKP